MAIENRYRWHSQNLTRNSKLGRNRHGFWKHSRMWLNWPRGELALEWVAFGKSCGIGLEVWPPFHSEHEFSAMLQIPFVLSLYVSVRHRPLNELLERLSRPHEWAIRVHDGRIWININSHPHESKSSDPWYRQIAISPINLLLGRAKFSRRDLGSEPVTIPMPERDYPARLYWEEFTYKRPLWFARHRLHARVEIPGGIPVPGKGESAWDLGEDAFNSVSGPYRNAREAVIEIVKSATDTRLRYGGQSWTPEIFQS